MEKEIKDMKMTKGQIAIWASVIGSIVVATIGGYFTFAGGNSNALAEETNERKKEDTEIKINVAILNESVGTIKSDVKEIKGYQQEILKRLPK